MIKLNLHHIYVHSPYGETLRTPSLQLFARKEPLLKRMILSPSSLEWFIVKECLRGSEVSAMYFSTCSTIHLIELTASRLISLTLKAWLINFARDLISTSSDKISKVILFSLIGILWFKMFWAKNLSRSSL